MLEHLFAGGGSAAPGLRSAAAARQEDIGERNPARGAYLASRKRLDDTLRRRFPIRSQWHARTWQHKQPLHHAGGRGRRLQPNAEQLAEITKIIAGLPTCSYRRAHALIL